MKLLEHFKQARAKPREPFRRSSFTVVSVLVREYHLEEGFVERLRNFTLGEEWLAAFEPPEKRPLVAPLFSLVPPEEYRLVQEIVAAAESPYLRFAHCPEELLLAGPLFRLNPDLDPHILAGVHFRTLVARELVSRKITALQRLAAGSNSSVPGEFWESLLDRLNALTHREER